MKAVNPVAAPAVEAEAIQQLEDLEGKVIGFLDNGWSSWTKTIDEFEEKLRSQYQVQDVKRWKIPIASEAPEEILQEAADQCDAVIVGLAN